MSNKIVIGSAYFGTKIKEKDSYKLLDYFIDSGGVTIDTANSYADWEKGGKGGDSERVIGSWLETGIKRDSVKIISKVGYEYSSVRRGLASDIVLNECNKSLERLGSDYIDLYLAHLDDNNSKLEVTIQTFNKLIDTGKIREWGLSNYSSARITEVIDICTKYSFKLPVVLENHYSLIEPADNSTYKNMLWEDLNTNSLKICEVNSIEPLAHSPLLWGAYSREDRPLWGSFKSPANTKRLEKLKKLSLDWDITPNQIVLAWIITKNPRIKPVIGVSNMEQLKENLLSDRIELTAEQLNKLEKLRSNQ